MTRQNAATRALDLALDALASYRLTKLVRDDMITQPLRDAVEQRHGPPDRSRVTYLLNCPWCLSVYFGLALALARGRLPGFTRVVSRALAVSALTGLLAERADASRPADQDESA